MRQRCSVRAARPPRDGELIDHLSRRAVQLDRELVSADRYGGPPGQPALRRGDGRDGASTPTGGTRSRPRRRSRHLLGRPARSARPGGTRRARSGAVEGELFHRGAVEALVAGRGARHPALVALVRQGAACARDRAHPARRACLPLPAPADPRRRLRRAPQGAAAPTCTNGSRVLARASMAPSGRARRDSSVTTSSRPTATAPSSARRRASARGSRRRRRRGVGGAARAASRARSPGRREPARPGCQAPARREPRAARPVEPLQHRGRQPRADERVTGPARGGRRARGGPRRPREGCASPELADRARGLGRPARRLRSAADDPRGQLRDSRRSGR